MADYTDIDKLRELAAAATPGPWYCALSDRVQGVAEHTDEVGGQTYVFQDFICVTDSGMEEEPDQDADEANAAYIAAASPDVILALVAELVGLRTEVDQLRTDMETLRAADGDFSEIDRQWSGRYRASALASIDFAWRQRDEADAYADEERRRVAAIQVRLDAATEGINHAIRAHDKLATMDGGDHALLTWEDSAELDNIRDHLASVVAALGVDPQKEEPGKREAPSNHHPEAYGAHFPTAHAAGDVDSTASPRQKEAATSPQKDRKPE